MPPEVKVASLRATMWQHLGALAVIALATVLFRERLTFWEPVGAALAVVGVVQLPAVLGRGPAGTLSVFALLLPGLKALTKAKWGL